MIAEIQCLPSPAGTDDARYAHVDAAIAALRASGLRTEVGPLGTSIEGPPDAVWAAVRAAARSLPAQRRGERGLGHQGRRGSSRRPRFGPGHRRPGRPAPAMSPAPSRGTVRRLLAAWGPPLLMVAVLIGAWELWVVVRDSPPYILPSPVRVAGAFGETAGLLPRHILWTVLESLVGLAAGAVAGAAVAALLAGVPLARRLLEPLLVASQTIPMIVLAPLLVIWFGIGATPKIVVVALITFFPVAVSTAAGLAGADPDLVELVRSMGARPGQVLRVVRVPAAIPSFFAGLRIAAAYAVAGAVIGELVAGDRGLGVFINRSRSSFQVDRIFVAVVIIAVLSALLFAAVGALARLASPWQRPPSPLPRPLETP